MDFDPVIQIFIIYRNKSYGEILIFGKKFFTICNIQMLIPSSNKLFKKLP